MDEQKLGKVWAYLLFALAVAEVVFLLPRSVSRGPSSVASVLFLVVLTVGNGVFVYRLFKRRQDDEDQRN